MERQRLTLDASLRQQSWPFSTLQVRANGASEITGSCGATEGKCSHLKPETDIEPIFGIYGTKKIATKEP